MRQDAAAAPVAAGRRAGKSPRGAQTTDCSVATFPGRRGFVAKHQESALLCAQRHTSHAASQHRRRWITPAAMIFLPVDIGCDNI
jgi:hypothetical protein